MAQRTYLVDFNDLLETAQSIGYDWNTAHDIMYKDGVLPWPGEHTINHHKNDINAYNFSDDTKKILLAFYADHDVEEFTLSA